MLRNRNKSEPVDATADFASAAEGRLEGARGPFGARSVKRLIPAGGKIFLLIGVIVVLLICYPLVRKALTKADSDSTAKQNEKAGPLRNALSQLVLKDEQTNVQPPPAEPSAAAKPSMDVQTVAQDPARDQQAAAEKVAGDLLARRLGAPLVSKDAAEGGTGDTGQDGSSGQPAGQPTNSGFSDGEDGGAALLKNKLKPYQLELLSAGRIADPDFTLVAGTPMSCITLERIVTTQPGTVSCRFTRDVYSLSGRVVLIDRGTIAFGHYDSMLTQGQSRIFVSWDRIVGPAPNYVAVRISSPGAGELGESGMGAYVDTHFWERFGGSVMLSIIDDGLAAATQRGGSGDNQVNFTNSSNNAQTMASEALKNTINIRPTAYASAGSVVNIKLANDLHFGKVYELRSAQ